MHVTKKHIEIYLSDVRMAIEDGAYQIASRYKNMDIYIDYLFTEEDTKKLLLSLCAEDFSEAVQNTNPKYSGEVLYIFGKDIRLPPRFGGAEEKVSFYIKLNKLKQDNPVGQYVIVISLHKQKHPLSYPFRVYTDGERMCTKKGALQAR